MEAQGLEYKSSTSKKYYFEGYIMKANSERNYINLNLFESLNNAPDKNGNYNFKILDSLKEFDLLLISEVPLPTKDAKKITNVNYLLNMKKEKGKMLAIVT